MLTIPTDIGMLFGGIYLVVIIIAFVINIALMIWVYRDAEKHGKSGALWLIIVLLTGCIGCIIYLIVRND